MPERQEDREAQSLDRRTGNPLLDDLIGPIGKEIVTEEARAGFPHSVLVHPTQSWKQERLYRNWVLGNVLGLGLALPGIAMSDPQSGALAAAGGWAAGLGGYNLWLWARRRKAIRQLEEKIQERFQNRLVDRLQALYRKDPDIPVGSHPVLRTMLWDMHPSTPLREVPIVLLRERVADVSKLGGEVTLQGMKRSLQKLEERGVDVPPRRVYPYDNPLTADIKLFKGASLPLLLAVVLGAITSAGWRMSQGQG